MSDHRPDDSGPDGDDGTPGGAGLADDDDEDGIAGEAPTEIWRRSAAMALLVAVAALALRMEFASATLLVALLACAWVAAGVIASSAARSTRQRRRLLVGRLVVVAVVAAVVTVFVIRHSDNDGWTIEASGRSTHLVADDETVCGTNREHLLFCLDSATGEEIFTDQLANRTEPYAIVDGTLLVGLEGTGSSSLRAYSLDGDRLWDVSVEDNWAPPVASGIVAVERHPYGAVDDALVGLDLATGEERWQASLTTPTRDPDRERINILEPLFTDGRSFYVTVNTTVYDDLWRSEEHTEIVAIDPRSGTERWRSSEIPWVAVLPSESDMVSIDDQTAVAFLEPRSDGDRRIVVRVAATGRQQTAFGDAIATFAHAQGVTVTLSGSELRGYDTDGDVLWTTEAPTGFSSDELERLDPEQRLFVARGVLYFHSSHVYTIDPHTGESHEVIGDGVDEVVVTADHLVAADACCPNPQHIRAHPL